MSAEFSVQIFSHEQFGDVRTAMAESEELLFFASDVAKALGYERPGDAVRAHCKKVNKFSYGDSAQPYNLIPESDVYRLIMRSKLKSAERFQDWVFEEVLPSIGRTGSYQHEQPEPEPTQPALTESTPADRRPLRDAVDRLVRTRYANTKVNNSHFREAWHEVNQYMEVSSIKDIPVENLEFAVEFVEEQIALCGENTPKIPAHRQDAIRQDTVLSALMEGEKANDPRLCLHAAKLSLLRALYGSYGHSAQLIFQAYNAVVEAQAHENAKEVHNV